MEEQVTHCDIKQNQLLELNLGYILSKSSVEVFVDAQINRDTIDEEWCLNSTDDGPEDFNLG